MTDGTPLHETYDSLVSEIDAGIDPKGLLVAREKPGMRIVGLIICLVVGTAAGVWAFALAKDAAKMPTMYAEIAGTAVFLGGSAFLLLYQVVFGSCYYVAMTDHDLVKRMGPRRLRAFPLSDVAAFERAPGMLCVRLRTGKRVTLMKSAYAPESVTTLSEKFNVWMKSPERDRSASLARIEVKDLLVRRRNANRVMLSGLLTAILCVVIIALAVALPAIAKDRAIIAGFGGLSALVQIVIGGILRLQARKPRTIPESEAV